MDLSLLNCPVCLEPATNPRETNCCNQVFCLTCLQPLQSCPFCRSSYLTYHENKVVTRILNTLPTACPFDCEATVTRGNLEAHNKICKQRLFDCPAPTCQTLAIKSQVQFLDHLMSQHADDVESAVQQFYATKRQSDAVVTDMVVEDDIHEESFLDRTIEQQARRRIDQRQEIAQLVQNLGNFGRR